MADELRQLEYSQRLRDRARNVVGSADARSTGRVLFEGAVAGGARALGVEARGVAGIVERAPADFLSLSEQSSALACREGDALLDTLIFAGGASTACGVPGKVVSQGRHHAREAVASRYVAALATSVENIARRHRELLVGAAIRVPHLRLHHGNEHVASRLHPVSLAHHGAGARRDVEILVELDCART